jgi:hypothetical protein
VLPERCALARALAGTPATWRPTKVLHTDSSTCWREARSELRDKRSASGPATKAIARFRAVAPWNGAMPFLELVQVLVSGQKPKGAGTPACHSFRKIGRLTLSLFLNPFENIVVANRAVRKEAVHRILLLGENFENRVQLSEDHQAQMKWETKQFQHSAGPHNPRVTEDQGAQSVTVNLRHAREVQDDVQSP